MQRKSWMELGVCLPMLLLPKNRSSLEKWCVIACDQYTSDRNYWERVRQEVGDAPSTLSMILPEAYLQDKDLEKRVDNVCESMERMLHSCELEVLPRGFMLVERTFSGSGKTRTGLLMALDLERYDYAPEAKTLIRATEETIPARIPPRLKIRERAILEFPHILVLINDAERGVIEPIAKEKQKLTKAYDSDLAFSLGHVRGYHIDEQQAESVRLALSRLYDELEKQDAGAPMLFAMGDGNHSFATAKALWTKVRETLTEADRLSHPARFALCEVVNVHDEGIAFEAIHRVAFHAGWEDFADVCRLVAARGIRASFEAFDGAARIEIVSEGVRRPLYIADDSGTIAAGTVDRMLEMLQEKSPAVQVDYIHGEAETTTLCVGGDSIGFMLPAIEKSQLFAQVSRHGPLPRKAFSMGEADEKRCYLEGRAITEV
jgi:hypothetical protein